MQLFTCTNCGQVVYFENTICAHCGLRIGFVVDGHQLMAVSAVEGKPFSYKGAAYRYCYNQSYGVCNWLVPDGGVFCAACALNRIIPDLQLPVHRAYWSRIEVAKHRLVYELIRLRLPFVGADPEKGLRFNFMRDKEALTGHDNGLITINIDEADDVERERIRLSMNEPYRTVLGHFRHEAGHFYWDLLIREGGKMEVFNQLFGDHRYDYGQTMLYYYQQGAVANWSDYYISAYASSHPWEDWAETWAHYLHIMDTFETAYAYRVMVEPRPGGSMPAASYDFMKASIDFDPFEEEDMSKIIQRWLPLTNALNSLTQSMGAGDLYPFVIVPVVVNKLGFIHSLTRKAAFRGM